jgi:peptidoglycan/xylan/chitin deacetylase (PgdA/CDA1 family)
MIFGNITQKFTSLVKNKRIYRNLIEKKGGIYILMYHSVSKNKNQSTFPYDISESSFKDQLLILNDFVEFVHPADLCSKRSIPITDQPQVLITFDDGYYNNYSIAAPILRDLGIPALFFVPTKFIDDSLKTFLNWSQVQELANDDLFVIGSHTCSHWNLKVMNSDDIIYEIQNSKKQLEKNIGNEIHFISYPGGGFDKEVIRHVERSRYEFGFKDRSQTEAKNEYTLCRISVDQSNHQPREVLRSMVKAKPINTEKLLRNRQV